MSLRSQPGLSERDSKMIVFLHVPKTAGTSFRFVLENTFGLSHCHAGHTKRIFNQADCNFARKFFPALKSIAGHNLIDPLRISFPNPYFITFLREPVARCLSDYQDSVVRGGNRKSFEESLREKGGLENLHVKLMAGERNLDKAKRFLERCDMVGLTEQFDLSLHILKRFSPYPLALQYRRRVVAPDNAIKKSIEKDERLMEMARDYNRLDLELYSFAAREIFPLLCEQAELNSAAPVESFEMKSGAPKLGWHLGRLYNKIFRQACKWRRSNDSDGAVLQYCEFPVRS